MNETSLSLLERARENPRDGSWDKLVEVYSLLLRGWLARFEIQSVDADDLVQDCLEAALTKQAMLQDPTRLRPWLYAILNNLFLMRLRSGARRGTALPIDEFADNLAASAAPQDRAVAMDLGRAMGRLSMEHRQILLLINLDGYSYQDVAAILDVPIGTVMSRLARARQRLRALLDGHDLRAMEP